MSARRMRPPGFSLLEVILALAILLGALAVLGEVARATLRNAQIAREQSRAQLLCESKLAEILAGISPAETVRDAPFEDQQDADWRYSVELEPAELAGLVCVRVHVYQNLLPDKRPAEFSLVQWIIDPGVTFGKSGGPDGSAAAEPASAAAEP